MTSRRASHRGALIRGRSGCARRRGARSGRRQDNLAGLVARLLECASPVPESLDSSQQIPRPPGSTTSCVGDIVRSAEISCSMLRCRRTDARNYSGARGGVPGTDRSQSLLCIVRKELRRVLAPCLTPAFMKLRRSKTCPGPTRGPMSSVVRLPAHLDRPPLLNNKAMQEESGMVGQTCRKPPSA
jgi:hypothetical protein